MEGARHLMEGADATNMSAGHRASTAPKDSDFVRDTERISGSRQVLLIMFLQLQQANMQLLLNWTDGRLIWRNGRTDEHIGTDDDTPSFTETTLPQPTGTNQLLVIRCVH